MIPSCTQEFMRKLLSSQNFGYRDKAGAYGVQGIGGCLIEKINGDFYTVMGMPLYSMTKRLNEIFSNN